MGVVTKARHATAFAGAQPNWYNAILMMHEQPPPRISSAEHAARLRRAEAIARSLGFVGRIEYRHAYGGSGGAQYYMAGTIEQDVLALDAEAFRRDAAGDDFSLTAIIAHERGHQLILISEKGV